MISLGDYKKGATIDFAFNTTSLTTLPLGSPISMTNTPSVRSFRGNNVTPIAAGVTFTPDFNATTGLNHVSIVTTDVAYAPGSDFFVTIGTGLVDGVSVVGRRVAHYSISNVSCSSPFRNLAFPFGFFMRSAAGVGVTGLVGSMTFQISKDGGALAAPAGVISEVGSGWYLASFTAADMDADRIDIRSQDSGAVELATSLYTA